MKDLEMLDLIQNTPLEPLSSHPPINFLHAIVISA